MNDVDTILRIIQVMILPSLGLGIAWIRSEIIRTEKKAEESRAGVKESLERLHIRQDSSEKMHRECQITLQKDFRTKEDAKEDSDRQWERLTDHARRLTRVETMVDITTVAQAAKER